MIFVCTGTQVYQFNRLLKKLDDLVLDEVITEDLFAQIGASTYIPKYYNYKKFLSNDKFIEFTDKADIIISHGGTGALIGALKKGKNVIAVPRLKKFSEHIDNHQLQIVNVLEKEGYLRAVYDIDDLGKIVMEAKRDPIKKTYSRESYIKQILSDYISQNL